MTDPHGHRRRVSGRGWLCGWRRWRAWGSRGGTGSVRMPRRAEPIWAERRRLLLADVAQRPLVPHPSQRRADLVQLPPQFIGQGFDRRLGACKSSGNHVGIARVGPTHRRLPQPGAQGIDREHPQAGSCQTAKDDGGKPGVRFLARSKRGTRFRTASPLGGTRQRRRRFCSPWVGRDQGRRHCRWRSPDDRNWLSFHDRYQLRGQPHPHGLNMLGWNRFQRS